MVGSHSQPLPAVVIRSHSSLSARCAWRPRAKDGGALPAGKVCHPLQTAHAGATMVLSARLAQSRPVLASVLACSRTSCRPLRPYTRTASRMSSSSTPLLITPQRLAALMNESKANGGQQLRILDATWFMPNVDRNARQEFVEKARIPTSTFWDVEEVASQPGEVDEQGIALNPLSLGHMMPTADKFARAAGACGASWCVTASIAS